MNKTQITLFLVCGLLVFGAAESHKTRRDLHAMQQQVDTMQAKLDACAESSRHAQSQLNAANADRMIADTHNAIAKRELAKLQKEHTALKHQLYLTSLSLQVAAATVPEFEVTEDTQPIATGDDQVATSPQALADAARILGNRVSDLQRDLRNTHTQQRRQAAYLQSAAAELANAGKDPVEMVAKPLPRHKAPPKLPDVRQSIFDRPLPQQASY